MSNQNFILVNEDGLFNTLIIAPLIAQKTLEYMEQALLEEKQETPNPKAAQEKTWQQQEKAISLIRTLPQIPSDQTQGVKDNGALRVPEDHQKDNLYVVPNLNGSFLTSVPRNDLYQFWEADAESWHLDTISEIFALEPALNKLAKLTENKKSDLIYRSYEWAIHQKEYIITPTPTPNKYKLRRKNPRYPNEKDFELYMDPEIIFDKTALRAANRLGRLVKDNKINIRSDNPIDVLGHADAFALYVEDDNQNGYLDGRGNFVDGVGGARLFESVKAAERTATSHKIRNAVVVALEVNVKGMAPGYSAANTDRLREVICHLTRSKLMDLVSSIRGEDISELRGKIDEREKQLNSESCPSSKPKM